MVSFNKKQLENEYDVFEAVQTSTHSEIKSEERNQLQNPRTKTETLSEPIFIGPVEIDFQWMALTVDNDK